MRMQYTPYRRTPFRPLTPITAPIYQPITVPTRKPITVPRAPTTKPARKR